MDELKTQLQQKLIANMVADLCKRQPDILFSEALCSQERCIRFATPLLRQLFPMRQPPEGAWGSGDLALYEIHNQPQDFFITATVSAAGLTRPQRKELSALLAAAGAPPRDGNPVLRKWAFPGIAGQADKITEAVLDFLQVELPYFERELRAWQKDHGHIIAPFPDVEKAEVPREALPVILLLEGAEQEIISNRYERSRAARRRCIAAWGTACQVCGFDFGAVYGPEFAGKIEVHHIVPVSEIGDTYVVDPVRDLRPVCPNCHTALHSKKGGVYTPEELKARLVGD